MIVNAIGLDQNTDQSIILPGFDVSATDSGVMAQTISAGQQQGFCFGFSRLWRAAKTESQKDEIETDTQSHLNLDVTIDPTQQSLAVVATIDLAANAFDTNEPIFWLNMGLAITENRVMVNGQVCELEKLDLELYKLPFHSGAVPYRILGDILQTEPNRWRIALNYAGHIEFPMDDRGMSSTWGKKGGGQITETEVELALYATWFPTVKGVSAFSHDLTLTLPEGFVAVSHGDPMESSTENAKTTWHWDDTADDSIEDINIMASQGSAKTILNNEEGRTVCVYSQPELIAVAQEIATSTMEDLDYYEGLFGQLPDESKTITIVVVPRKGQSYSRLPLIVLSGDGLTDPNKIKNVLATQSHELAHFWFSLTDATTTNNWIDEGMAQYASFLAIERAGGRAAVELLYQKALIKEAGSPIDNPLAQTLRTDGRDGNRLYTLGMMTFARLHQVMGDRAFFCMIKGLRKFGEERDVTTQDVRDLALRFGGVDAAFVLDSLVLNVPAIPQIEFSWTTEARGNKWDINVAFSSNAAYELKRIPVQVGFEDGTLVDFEQHIAAKASEAIWTFRKKPVSVMINPDNKAPVLVGDSLTAFRYSRLMMLEYSDADRVEPGLIEEMQGYINAMKRQTPDDPNLTYYQGKIYFLQTQHEQALACFEQVIQQLAQNDVLAKPGEKGSLFGQSIVHKGLIFDALGRREEAVAIYNEILTHSKDHSWLMAVLFAKEYLKQPYNPNPLAETDKQ